MPHTGSLAIPRRTDPGRHSAWRPRRHAFLLALGLGLPLASPADAQGISPQSTTSGGSPAVSDGAPLTLTSLLTRVSAGHPLLAAARARVGSARGARRTAAVLPNPMLSSHVENVRLPGREPLDMDRETMATATFPLEFLYQRGARVAQAEASVRAVEADALTQRQRLALDAAHAYYRAALGQVEVATARDLATWLDSLVAYNQARAGEGAAAESDLLRTQLERDRAWADMTMHEVELARARADLAALLDGGPSVPAAVRATTLAVATPDTPLPLDGVPEVRPAESLDGRPEVRAGRARLAAASAGVGAARSLLVRELSVMAGLKWTGGTTSLVAGLSLPLPLFNQNGGEIGQARAERDVATAELAAAERTALADIAAANEGARLLTERTELLARGRNAVEPRGAQPTVESQPEETIAYLVSAEEARRIALGAYREGAVPLLQVLDVARAWGEARVTYYHILYAQHEGVLAVLAAQGRDLFVTVPTLTPSTTNAGAVSPGPNR